MNWKIPLFEPDLGDAEVGALTSVIRSKWLTMGERTREFEVQFAQMVAVPHAIATSNCTTGLHLALLAVGVGPGDEVICPSLTFVATANAIRYCGATPVFADVGSMEEWNLSAASVEARLSPRTRAVLVVHYAGYMCDMGAISALAAARGLAVVEDAAHSPGARWGGRQAGAFGDAAAFSFFSNKNMTTGEGGMVTTRRDDVADRVRTLRSHGMTTLTLDRHKGHAFSYDVVALGYNYRMSELTAALGLTQLGRLAQWNARRLQVAARYRERLQGIVEVPFTGHLGDPVPHIMPVLLPEGTDRLRLMRGLAEMGIQSSIHYRPVDTFAAYRDAGLGPCGHLPLTHSIGNRVVTLPLYPGLTLEQIDAVCSGVARLIGER